MKEVIIIGTSPLAIAEASLIKSKGKSVINLDSKNTPGGAWVTFEYKNIPKVEIGCHIWSYNKNAYQFISEFFGLNIINLAVQPKIVFKNKFIPYRFKSNLIIIQKISKSFLKLDFKFFKELKKHPELRLSLSSVKFKYPKTGAKEIEEGIHRIILKNKLDIKLNTTVHSIELSKTGGRVLLNNGDDISFKKEIILTSLSQVNKITFEDGTSYEPVSKEVKYIHRHLIIKGSVKKKFSYIRFMDDDLIHRMSDMTSQVKSELKADTFLICVGIHPDAFYKYSVKQQESRILDILISKRLFNSDAKVIVSESNVFPSFYVDKEDFNIIESRSNKRIRFLRSTDFVYGFHGQLERFASLLD